MYSGGRTLADFWENWKTRVFRFWEKSDKVGPTSRPRFGAFQTVVSRARAVKNILAAPDGSGGPPEASGPAQMFFLVPRARGGGISHGVGGARAWRDFLRISQNPKTRVFQFSPQSAKVLPPLYMRAAPLQKPMELFAREPRNKTHHGPPVAPPASAWCVLFRGSRAKSSMGF